MRAVSVDEEFETSPQVGHRFAISIAGSLPKRVELNFSNQLDIAKNELPPELRNQLVRLAAFQNPDFRQAQAMRLPTTAKPCIIGCSEDCGAFLRLPRGCLDETRSLLAELGIESVIRDERHRGIPIAAEFVGELTQDQEEAARDMLAHDIGVLSATTGFGKTVIGAWLVAQRGVNTLILVHRRHLMEQWLDRLSTFLKLPANSLGMVGSGRSRPTGIVDVATIQSLNRKGKINDLISAYGHVIVDECHHLSASTFEQVIREAKAMYVTGLSATVNRKDGRHPIVLMQCGPVRHRIDARAQAAMRPFEHTVTVRPTGFRPLGPLQADARLQFQELYSQLISEESRNRQICDDVLQAVASGRSPLVVTERNEQLDMFAACFSPGIRHVVVFRGGMKRTEILAAAARLNEIPEHEPRVLLSTGSYIGEGFDDARLDTLFLALPVSWRGTIAQYVGRLHRLHHRKREVMVYDYADLEVPMLSRMFDRRCRGYEALGYKLLLPGSAVAGWPQDVSLPVDPQWKQEYAATVRRLIRDKVDTSLANLFVHVARSVTTDSVGEERARSATEAFLYRRLETLTETQGRFVLNSALPIPFDGNGQMEVDLLCAEARVAVELDGMQHLQSVEAYRKDRRKDLLLQENGYVVLRFLTEDVGTRLDLVLDAILRTLAARCQQPAAEV